MVEHKQRRIVFPSFPRSGHHLIISLIKAYAEEQGLPFSYCEFYSHDVCCLEAPQVCIPADGSESCDCNTLLHKTHDFGLNPYCEIERWKSPVFIEEDTEYIVLHRRDKVRQFEAWYRHHKETTCIDYDLTKETYAEFVNDFYKINIEYYNSFIAKWVNGARSHENIHVFTYEELLESPSDIMNRILSIVYPDYEVSLETLNNIIDAHDICLKHELPDATYQRIEWLMRLYDRRASRCLRI